MHLLNSGIIPDLGPETAFNNAEDTNIFKESLEKKYYLWAYIFFNLHQYKLGVIPLPVMGFAV